MEKRIFDLLLGLSIGHYIAPIITVSVFSVHWAVLGLVIMGMIRLFKKLGRFVWTKWIKKWIAKLIIKILVELLKEELN